MLIDFKELVGKKISADDKRELEKYKFIIQAEPDKRPEVHFKLGKLYEKTGKKELAINEYATAARLYARVENHIGAIAANKSIIHLEPDNKNALADLAYIHHFQEEDDDTLVEQYDNFLQETETLLIERQETSTHELKERKGKKDADPPPDSSPKQARPLEKSPAKTRSRLALGSHATSNFDKDFEFARSSLIGMIEGKVKVDTNFESKRESLVGTIKESLDSKDIPKTEKKLSPHFQGTTPKETTESEASEIEHESYKGLKPSQGFGESEEWLVDLRESVETEEDILIDLSKEPGKPPDRIVSHLKGTPLFAKLCHRELQQLEKHGNVHHVAANTLVMPAGNSQKALFIVLDGIVNLKVQSQGDRETLLAILGKGEYFGEFALFGQQAAPLFAVSQNACTVLEITKSGILPLAKKCPHIVDALKKHYRQHRASLTLARVTLFNSLSSLQRQHIADSLFPIRVKKGTVILTEGEREQSLYLITTGEVEVATTLVERGELQVIQIAPERLHLATLKAGDFFGEGAYLTKEPRSATVSAFTDVQLLKLPKRYLDTIIQHHPEVAQILTDAHQRRAAATFKKVTKVTEVS